MVVSIKDSVEHFIDYFNKSFKEYKNKININLSEYEKDKPLLIMGMGGSGIAGMIIESFFPSKKIFALTTNQIPRKFEDSNFILVSYSGNTKEVLGVYQKHHKKVLCVLTSGGKLEEIAKDKDTPIIKLPIGFIPRSTLPHMIVILLYVLKELRIISLKDIEKIKKIVNSIDAIKIKDKAKEISEKIDLKETIIFLTSYRFYVAAYRSKTQINENCKMHSYAEYFSEHNHNSIMALEQHNPNIFYILYEDKEIEMNKRMSFFRKKAQSLSYKCENIALSSKDHISTILSYILFGDYLSVFIANRFNINMENGDIIKELKIFIG